jgi:hypothetical protein
MKLKAVLLFGLILVFSCSIFAQGPVWFKNIKKIKIFQSTREDVARIFGQPKNPINQYNNIYELKEGELDVEYSRGLCSSEKREGWNVPEFVITRIFFTPNKQINHKKLLVGSNGFHKYEIRDVPGAFIYENDEKGIRYSITSKGKIEAITFYPPSKYDYLFCNS